jgi:phosphate transport system substrate-binding protein
MSFAFAFGRFVRTRTIAAMCLGLAGALPLVADAAEVTGAGSTFVYPILAKWADSYRQKSNVSLNY